MKSYFSRKAHRVEKKSLPLLRLLIERYSDERPFLDCRVAFSHILVRNSLVVAEALAVGGAELFICNAHQSPAVEPVLAELHALGIDILPVSEATNTADLFVDVNAVLGRQRTPTAAAEVTRTGIHHYADIPCPVISADDCRAKRIEGFFGTGDGFIRAWMQFRPDDPLQGKHVLQFGYGKIGRGVAHCARRAGMHVTVAEMEKAAGQRAADEGFSIVEAGPTAELERVLKKVDIVISVTGVPGVIGKTLPVEWLRANQPVLINLGAEDEFGQEVQESEILGGKQVPLNFHLAQPTLNRYVDPPLAAHVLALEAWVCDPESYPVGIHPLPIEMDEWLIREWRKAWPDEDLVGIAKEINFED